MIAPRLVLTSVLFGLLGTPATRTQNPVRSSGPMDRAAPVSSLAGNMSVTPASSPGLTVGVSVTPSNGTDPTQRLEDATGNQVTFTVKNTGTEDTRYTRECTRTGSVVFVDCSFITGILIPGEERTVTATFTTGNAGPGTVQLTVTSTQPPGASGTGVRNVTVISGSRVTPDGDALVRNANTAYSSNFTITNKESARTYGLVAVCSGSGVTNCSATPTSVTLDALASQPVTVSYSTQSGVSTGTVELQAQLVMPAVNDFASGNSITGVGGTAQVTLDPSGASDNTYTVHYFVSVTANPPAERFNICTLTLALETNDGSGWVERAAFTYTSSTDSESGSETWNWPHEQKQLVVSGLGLNDAVRLRAKSFTKSNGTGSFRVRGGDGSGSNPETYNGITYTSSGTAPVVVDRGWVSVTVLPPASAPGPLLDVASVNPGDVLARQHCLTMALASAAASECGDLRIIYALPSVRTMNRWRTPTLLYASAHAIGWASVAANVTLPGSDVPTTVSAVLKVGDVICASGSWAGAQWTPASTRRIALGFSAPAEGLTTGVHDYVLEVTRIYPDSNPMNSVSGKLAIVDRSTSYFGAGWWLAGLEKWDRATGVWVGGDGSVRQYVLRPGSVAPSRVWGAPSVTYPDTIRELNGEFVRQLPDSVWAYFDAQGRHIRTRNRQGHITTFSYFEQTDTLTAISLPPSGALQYTLNRTTGKLSSIVAPGVPSTRTVTLTINATTGRLTSILEPENRSVAFGYGSDNKIASRTDRRGTVTDFQYDAGSRVSQATINLQPGTITRTLRQAASQGSAGTAVALADVFTRLDGPRSVNTTSFYVNQFGAPDSIIDALGQRTRLLRTDTRFLAAVTHLIGVTGHTIAATYDERGRILTSSEPATSDPTTATTTYAWDPKWDQVTTVTNPEGDFTEYSIDASTGNRMWQQDARLSTSRTTFTYNANNQVATVTVPTRSAQVLTYDTKGNLETYTSALAMQTTWTNDNIGRTTQIQTPTGTSASGWTPYQTETIGYSIRNEETSRVTTGSDNTSITVGRTYDEEGNLLTLNRSFSPKAAGITLPLTTTWVYDRANRPIKQIEADGTADRRVFDAAGNLVADTTRRDSVITMTYDPLNRLSTRRVPPVTYDLPATWIYLPEANTQPYSYTWTVDNQTFQYSPDGQVRVATNKDATVRRSFHASGALMTDTLDIKKWDRLSSYSYGTAYTYDRHGRRSTLAAPSQFTGSLIRYQYWFWGPIKTVTDIASNTFAINYNPPGEVSRIDFGGSISQTFGYDGDGRVRSDVIANGGSQIFPYYPSPLLRNFSVNDRNARGQIIDSDDPTQSDRVKATYTDLGYVKLSNLHQNLVNVTIGGFAEYASGDNYNYDAMGNILATLFADSIRESCCFATSSHTGGNSYTAHGRLNQHQSDQNVTTYSYDASGNTYFERTHDGVHYSAERAAYFTPDEKVVATDTRGYGRRRTFEEYRYDALGRRVWARSIMTCEPSGQSVQCNIPFDRRTIWDGFQELAEVQSPIDEGDTGYLDRSWEFSPADPNPFYGRVVYGPGLRVDQPLSVTRYEYRDKPGINASSLMWPRFTWQIYWNYKGLPAYGTLTTGAWANPYQLGSGQTSCPSVGTQTTQRCVLVQWPLAHSAYDQNRGKVPYPSWHGSLLDGKRDRSGLEYKRNRQYDPGTGRFTQEDPIGLAGGLNAYGFAGGDPVGNSDPFGLYCWREGTDKLICTGAPGDWHTISQFLGGAVGWAVFHAAAHAGLTAWSSKTCQGGFYDQEASARECSRIAAGLAKLIVSNIEKCSAYGTSAAKRFERGRFKRVQGWVRLPGGADGFGRALGSRTLISSFLFDMRQSVANNLAHEEWHHHEWAPSEEPATEFGNECSGELRPDRNGPRIYY